MFRLLLRICDRENIEWILAVNYFFAKRTIIDVWQDPKYVSRGVVVGVGVGEEKWGWEDKSRIQSGSDTWRVLKFLAGEMTSFWKCKNYSKANIKIFRSCKTLSDFLILPEILWTELWIFHNSIVTRCSQADAHIIAELPRRHRT